MIVSLCIGGFLGAISRYGCQKLVNIKGAATIIVNISGSFLIGLTLALPSNDTLYFFFVLGFLGAFTTFSTFTLDILQLAQTNKKLALRYVFGTLAGSYIAVALGYGLALLYM